MPKFFETLSNAPYLFEREVVLSERNNRKIGTKKATFPNRRKRLTWLEVRATHQEIFTGNGSSAHLPPSLRLNFVEVREPYPPEGEEPIIWRLVTTEPIDTEENVAAIIDAYLKRWLIEEFFKALKTGCCYQQHQLKSGKTLLVLLAIETAVAWRMLLLRWLAHNASDAPAEKVLNSTQLSLLLGLIQQKKRQIPDRITVSYILFRYYMMT